MSRLLFNATNQHNSSSGEPPSTDGDSRDFYYGYFVNRCGGQLIYSYCYETSEALLQGGDSGWGNCYGVENGQAVNAILAPEEATWLQACWAASTRAQRDESAG